MLLGVNISLLLGLILPPLLYVLIIYLTSPYKSIKLLTGIQYLMVGFSSLFILQLIFVTFPHWYNGPTVFQETFFYIAPREEISKLLAFLIIGAMRKGMGIKDHPIGTMFYMAMVGLGFAMYENVHYVLMYGPQVLGIRIVTATIAHMLFGMFMGYWIALGRINTGKYGNRSVFGVIMTKNPRIKQLVYIFIGLLAAVGYHGLWNYNLMIGHGAYYGVSDVSDSTMMIMILMFGLVGTKFAVKDLNDNYRRKTENNKENP